MADPIPALLLATPSTPSIVWGVYVVGKPGFDYSGIENRFVGQILTWNFATQSQEDVISMAAKVAKQIATLDKWLEAAKDVLKLAIVTADTLGVGDSLQISGSGSWGATCSRRERTGIDLEMLKTEFGDAWIAQHSKTTNYYEIRFKEIK